MSSSSFPSSPSSPLENGRDVVANTPTTVLLLPASALTDESMAPGSESPSSPQQRPRQRRRLSASASAPPVAEVPSVLSVVGGTSLPAVPPRPEYSNFPQLCPDCPLLAGTVYRLTSERSDLRRLVDKTFDELDAYQVKLQEKMREMGVLGEMLSEQRQVTNFLRAECTALKKKVEDDEGSAFLMGGRLALSRLIDLGHITTEAIKEIGLYYFFQD